MNQYPSVPVAYSQRMDHLSLPAVELDENRTARRLPLAKDYYRGMAALSWQASLNRSQPRPKTSPSGGCRALLVCFLCRRKSRVSARFVRGPPRCGAEPLTEMNRPTAARESSLEA